jgi:predicted component of type VI protein secretion system
MDEFVDIEKDFDEVVKRQKEALLQIVKNTLKNERDGEDEFDLEKELEKIKNTKPDKSGKWYQPQ